MWFIGMIFGAILGSMFGRWGAFFGAGLGIWLTLKWSKPADATNETSAEAAFDDENEAERRIAALEKNVLQLTMRIRQLENALNIKAPAPLVSTPPAKTPPPPAAEPASQTDRDVAPASADTPTQWAQWWLEAASPPRPTVAEQTPFEAAENLIMPPPALRTEAAPTIAERKPVDVVHPPIRPPIRVHADDTPKIAAQTAMPPPSQTESAQSVPPESEDSPPSALSALWAKLFSGNILAKIGVALLFFGVASALKLAVAHGMFPVPVRLLLGAVGAVTMVMFGWSRAQTAKHQMFGFALQGGGFAILYLLVYFMLVTYNMITPTSAFIAYTLLGVSCTLFAAKQDSLSLAVLGISGAFLSPVLAASENSSHITLFSYFALLNVFVFSLNWFKSWRQLNIVGFLFTLVIGMRWALHAYQPEHFNSTEFFLVLFFLMYSIEPVCYALFRQATAMQWGDGLLLFGTPAIAVASQAVLMRPFEDGQAWSVFVMGLYYLALWWGLYRKNEEPLKLSERSHLGIALTLLTYAVPLAFGAQVTSAIWSVEGCAVLWLGIRQDRYLARWTGIALQLLAGWYFADHIEQLSHTHAVFNDVYLGSFIVALAGMASGLMQHRWENKTNQVSADALFYWGLAWFVLASYIEIDRFVHVDYQNSAWLGYFALTALLLEIGGKHWSWAALRQTLWLFALALAAVASHAIMQQEHVLGGALTLVYPAAVGLFYWLLARQASDELDTTSLQAGMFWGLSVLVSNETAWAIQHYLFPNDALWYWLPFGITFSAIAMWRGIRDDEPLARVLGIAVQLALGLYLFEKHDELVNQFALLNDFYLGSLLLSLLGGTTAWWLHRKNPAAFSANAMFYWGLAWLVAPTCMEISTALSSDVQDAAWLGFIAAVVVLLEINGKREHWAALRQMIWLSFIAIGGIAADATFREHHLLHGMLLLVFPAAVALYYWQLARHERDEFNVGLPALHLGMFWGLAALVSHEISWGIQQLSPNNELWHGLAYGISFALITLGTLVAHARQYFPTTTSHANYPTQGLLPVVFASIAWFAFANVSYSGDSSGLPYFPVLNPLDLAMLLSLFSIFKWLKLPQHADLKSLSLKALPAGVLLWVSTLAARLAHNWGGVPFDWDILMHNALMHALLSVIWTLTSITLMIYASRQSSRKIWFVGFGLLSIVGAKLMLVDLRNTGTITWTASLIGIALLVIAASYFSPAPPKGETEGEQ